MDAAPLSTIVQLDDQFRSMIRKYVAERDKVIIGDTVTLQQLHVLTRLKQEGPMKAGRLSKGLQFSAGAMTAVCDKLVKGNYINRIRPQNDKRIMLLSITDKGERLLKEAASLQRAHLKLLFDGFSEKEMQMLYSFSHRLHHNLNWIFGSTSGCSRLHWHRCR
ncbi:MarR family winged helix-turn-helix transcriptional regulator [Paenibacillus sp. UNC451MF]|uniref:MarR family winged helix-turn-helix transcriptional regulator n=1 Tax=Paenibacillus sp. UNC451MF TaxID=1449063 RepID=UPI000690DEEF|nr:MarR family transcriptional regulator [Paenibacillus sp. UNC451MF]